MEKYMILPGHGGKNYLAAINSLGELVNEYLQSRKDVRAELIGGVCVVQDADGQWRAFQAVIETDKASG